MVTRAIGLYRDVWIAAIASSRKSPATQTAAICVRFQGRRVRHVYVTMHVTFLTRISALIYRRGLRQRANCSQLTNRGLIPLRQDGDQTSTFGEMSTFIWIHMMLNNHICLQQHVTLPTHIRVFLPDLVFRYVISYIHVVCLTDCNITTRPLLL